MEIPPPANDQPSSFAGEPISLAEHRAIKAGDASKWTPRDMLISILRDIDSGVITPTDMVLVFRMRDEEGFTKTHFAHSGSSIHVSLGLLERAKYLLQRDL